MSNQSPEKERETAADGKPGSDWKKVIDILIRVVNRAELAAWLLFITALGLFLRAKPSELDTNFNRFRGVPISRVRGWDSDFLQASLWTMAVVVLLCMVAAVFNVIRFLRQEDRFKTSAVFLLAAAISCLVAYWYTFAR